LVRLEGLQRLIGEWTIGRGRAGVESAPDFDLMNSGGVEWWKFGLGSDAKWFWRVGSG